MKKIEKNKKRFKLFDLNRDGKGVYEQENRKPTLRFFFVLLFRKITQLLQLNAMMLFQVLPILGIVAIYVFGAKQYLSTNITYAPMYGITKVTDSPSLFTELDLIGQHTETAFFTPWMIIGIIVLALFLFITFGWQNVGAAYILRGLFRGDPVFVFSDFFHAIKRNLLQGFVIGIIDFICCAALIVDLVFFFASASMFNAIIFGIIVAITIIYLFMRFYIYQLLITFELKTVKIFKNALIFSILGIFRNLLALVGIIILIAIHILLIIWLLPLGISIPLILPFFYILSIIGFMGTFAAYPVIEKYMITPYENQATEDDSPDDLTEKDTEENNDTESNT